MQSLENSRSRWKRFAINENNMAKDKKTNLSPQSLIISAFTKIKNVKKSITPQLIDNNELSLVYLDLSKTKKRLGGSIFRSNSTNKS